MLWMDQRRSTAIRDTVTTSSLDSWWWGHICSVWLMRGIIITSPRGFFLLEKIELEAILNLNKVS